MQKLKWVFVSSIFILNASLLQAAGSSLPSLVETLNKKLNKKFPDLEVIHAEPSKVPGVLQVQTASDQIVYLSEDARYLFSGDLIDLQENDLNLMNVSENKKKNLRISDLRKIPQSNMIVFPVQNGTAPKARLTVFMNLDCPHCQAFHDQELRQLNQKGIELRYLAFPSQAPGSKAFDKAAHVWCAQNRTESIESAMKGVELKPNTQNKSCSAALIWEQVALAKKLQIRGTPAVIFEDGTMSYGRKPVEEMYAQALLHRLN